VGLIGRLIVGVIGGLIYGLIVGMIFGMLGGLVGGLIGDRDPIGYLIRRLIRIKNPTKNFSINYIETVEAFQISISRAAKRKFLENVGRWLIYELICGLMVGLIFGLIYWQIHKLINKLIDGLIYGAMVGLMCGLIYGLMCGLIYGLKEELKVRSRPNQGIWNSLQSVFWTTAICYPFGLFFTTHPSFCFQGYFWL
jgi:hypothetical protein